jgi:hypothetical protein
MVKGLDLFRGHFAAFSDQYLLIGGAAASLVLDEAGLDFRATKDLDIVLCVEALTPEFGAAFWDFIKAGKYQNRMSSSGKTIFYRFDKPSIKSFPYMLELFARPPFDLVMGDDHHLTRIPVGEDISSLSAILLIENYYEFLHAHHRIANGISVVDEVGLIPLKARAWLDLTRRQEEGERIDRDDINKHRSDVLRLFQLLSPGLRIELPDNILQDTALFIRNLEQQTGLRLEQYGLRAISLTEIVGSLRTIYGIDPSGMR